MELEFLRPSYVTAIGNRRTRTAVVKPGLNKKTEAEILTCVCEPRDSSAMCGATLYVLTHGGDV